MTRFFILRFQKRLRSMGCICPSALRLRVKIDALEGFGDKYLLETKVTLSAWFWSSMDPHVMRPLQPVARIESRVVVGEQANDFAEPRRHLEAAILPFEAFPRRVLKATVGVY